MSRLVLPDADSLRDLATYAARARTVTPTGSVRLVGAGPALACYAGVLEGSGLFGAGLVVALRVLDLAEPSDIDLTLSSERLVAELGAGTVAPGASSEAPGLGVTLDVEGDPVPPRWAAQTPPRSGWDPVGLVAHDDVVAASRAKDPATPTAELPDGLSAAVAIAMRGLGLLDGDPVLYRNGPWRRLSTSRGHVLTR